MMQPLRVLIVEDREDDVRLIERELRKGGHVLQTECVTAEPAFRRALAESTWDLVIADYALPSFNGLAALAILKQTGIDLPRPAGP